MSVFSLTNTRIITSSSKNKNGPLDMALLSMLNTIWCWSTQMQAREWFPEQLLQEGSWELPWDLCHWPPCPLQCAEKNVINDPGKQTLRGEQTPLDPNPTFPFPSLARSFLSTHSCLLLSVYRTPPPRPDLSQWLNSRARLPKSSCPLTCELLFMFWGPMPSASPSHHRLTCKCMVSLVPSWSV